MQEHELKTIVSKFDIEGTVSTVKPLGNGLINDTYKVTTADAETPDMCCRESTTPYLRMWICSSITSKLWRVISAKTGTGWREWYRSQGAPLCWHCRRQNILQDENDKYWRISVFILMQRLMRQSPEYAYYCGLTFGNFEAMLVDIPWTSGWDDPRFP